MGEAPRATMRRSARAPMFLLIVVAAWPMSTEAAVNFYRMGKRIAYEQTSDSQPTTPISFDGGVDLLATSVADLTSARVFSTSPTLLSPASPFTLTQSAPGYWVSGQFYSSLEEMDTYLPPGDIFGYLIEGGDFGSRLALLRLPPVNLFAADVPHFTNNAFSELNGLDVTSPYSITWNGFTPAAEVDDAPIFFTVYRVSDWQPMISTVVNHSVVSFTIPANTFAPGTLYRADLDYSARQVAFDAGFLDADATSNFDLLTGLYFTTGGGTAAATPGVPEPAGLVLFLGGLFAAVAMRLVNRRLAGGCLALSVFMAFLPGAEADLDFYRMGKTIAYQQTSESQPTVFSSMYGGVDLFSPTPSDIGSARVFSTTTMPPSPVPEFVLTEFAPGYWGSSQGFSSLAEMDTTLPPGDTFGFLIEDGSLGSQLALLPIPPANLFATDVPYFTGTTFNQLSDLDPTLPLTLHWNSFTPPPGITDAPIFLNVYRVSDGQSEIGTVVSTSVTSFEIPANTLAANTQYVAALDFSSRVVTPDAGFTNADATLLFDLVTELYFTTSDPLAGDYNRDGTVDAADYVLWRKTLGQMGLPPYSGADGDGDGNILAADYDVWQANFGAGGAGSRSAALAAPEGTTATFALSCVIALAAGYRLRR